MKLYFDEDIGRGIAEALRAVGLRNVSHTRYVFRERFREGGTVPDEDWIRFVAHGGWIGFSANTGILEAEAQRRVIIDEGAGVVFLTSGRERSVDVLKLVLRKWEWLEAIDAHEPRPFAFLLSRSGRVRRDPRVP